MDRDNTYTVECPYCKKMATEEEQVQELISAIDNDIVQNNAQYDDYWKIYAGLLQHKVWAYERLLALKSKS